MTTTSERLLIEYLPVEQLIPYAKNARTHSDTHVAQIAASIREFGWTNPVLVDGESGIIAGHGRVLAARKLGMTEVPVIELAGMTEAQRRAYILADNKLALNAGWDEELLALELADLKALEFDLPLTGFSQKELETLLRSIEGVRDGLTDPDAVPEEPEETYVRPGDLYQLGDHRVLCGDALDREQHLQLLENRRASLCFTDPPYNVGYQGGVTRGRRKIANDDLGEAFAAFLEAACRNIFSVTDGACYICMSSAELATLQWAFRDAGGHWSTFLIWGKNTFTLGRSDYQRQFEPILYGWKEGARHYWCGGRDQGDLWLFDKPSANPLHPTQKPVALIERAIQNSSRAGEIVLDPFLGSGSTLMAAERTGRACYGIELEPKYVQVAITRWEEHTGRKAVKLNG